MNEMNWDVQLPGWDSIPDDDVLDTGYYQMECISLIKDISGTGKTILKGEFYLTEANPQHHGRTHYEMFTLGTEADPTPEAIDPTLFSVKQLIRMFRAMQMPPTNSLNEALVEAVGKRFECRLNMQEQKDGEYAGRRQNRFSSFFPINSKALGPIVDQRGARQTQPNRVSSNNAAPTRQTRQPYTEPSVSPEASLAQRPGQ